MRLRIFEGAPGCCGEWSGACDAVSIVLLVVFGDLTYDRLERGLVLFLMLSKIMVLGHN